MILTNIPAVDYVRGTTWDFKAYQGTVWECAPGNESGKPGGFQQYKGTRYDTFFHGQADIKGRVGYLVETSGYKADDQYMIYIKNNLHLTRLDVQITVELPSWWDLRETKDAIKYGVWPGRVRDVMLLESDTGTIAIGDRSSDRYIRIYEKQGAYIRFEVEYKHDRVMSLVRVIQRSGREVLGRVLAGEVDRLPQTPLSDYLHDALGNVDPQRVRVSVGEADRYRQLKWLASLLPSIRALMSDHDIGHSVRGWFVDMLDQTDNERW